MERDDAIDETMIEEGGIRFLSDLRMTESAWVQALRSKRRNRMSTWIAQHPGRIRWPSPPSCGEMRSISGGDDVRDAPFASFLGPCADLVDRL